MYQEHQSAAELSTALKIEGLDAEVALADAPTFYALHQAILRISNQTPKTRVAVFESEFGLVSLAEGTYHLSIWAGLPKIGSKLHTVHWQGAAEGKLMNEIIRRQVGAAA